MIDEITARQSLQRLLTDYHAHSPERRKQFSEADVVRQFLDRLFRDVLGWPIEDNDRYKYELSTKSGRPDLTLIPESGGTIFIEAKKFGVIKELQQARYTIAGTITPGQMALPGMSVDRTEEEQQAINYAFENGGTWAILSNFERLRLFNARRDWLVLSFESPDALLRDFDLLWQLAYPNILQGSLDALSNQRHTEEVDTAYLEFINEWRERLARDALRDLEANPWLRRPDGTVDLQMLRDAVQRFLDRLVVIRFAEDHLVIPAGTLYTMYEGRKGNIYTFSLYEFMRKLFTNFDQAHNSALFAKTALDSISFSGETLEALVIKLYAARYRAMPADILGNTYEQYLGKALTLDGGMVITRDNLETRKKQGSYYTPQVIVRYIVDHSLGRWLYGTADGRPDGTPLEGETRKSATAGDLDDLRVLDAACGSGSFLIYAYYVLAEFYERERARLDAELLARKRELAGARMLPTEIEGDATVIYLNVAIERLADYPRRILEHHLYGVDLDPQAAEIAVVNLMMRAMERRRREKRLPLILNQNVKVGNALVGQRPDDPRLDAHAAEIADLIRLRQLLTTDPDYLTSDQREKMATAAGERIIANLDDQMRLQHSRALRNHFAVYEPLTEEELYPTYTGVRETTAALAAHFDPDYAAHFADTERVRPFHWAVEFPEVFFNPDGTRKPDGGFTVIFGNPPWEILKPDLREFYAQFDERIESRFSRAEAEARIEALNVEDPARRATWDALTAATEQFSAYIRRTPDYARQGRGDTATHKLFMERAFDHLLARDGRLGYLVPSGIYTDLGTKDLREMLLNEGGIQYIYSFSNERFFFPGVHHSFKFALIGAHKGTQNDGFWAAFRFNPRVAVRPDDLPSFLANPDNLIYVRRDSLAKFNPSSLSVMEFQTRRDYEIAERIYADYPLLGDDVPNAWNPKFTREFDMTNDRDLFHTAAQIKIATGSLPKAFVNPEGYVPLYEGKMVHQYDAFYGDPQYWIEQAAGRERLKGKNATKFGEVRIAIRLIGRSTDERTLISAIIPPLAFCGHSLCVQINDLPNTSLVYVLALLNSYTMDYIMRLKVATNIGMYHLYQLPMPRLTAGNPFFDAIVPRAARLVCTRPEYAALWESVMGETWSESSGAVQPHVREALRAEIDALVAHLYGLSRDEYAHILGTFPLVFPDNGEGAARREAVLAAYDALAGVGG